MIRKSVILILCTMVPLLAGGKKNSKKAVAKDDITAYHKETFGEVKFNKYGIAQVFVQDKGWVAINKQKKVLYQIFMFDNGPDYESEGLYRFVENNKMGFANEKGQKIIPAKFDFVAPFEGGKADFCNGCQKEYHGEHYEMKGGTWGKINKKGKEIPE